LLDAKAKPLNELPDCVDVGGKYANVGACRLDGHEIRSLVEKEFHALPPQCGEVFIAALELEPKRGVHRERSVEIADEHLDDQLISQLR
jgi:hypothetical protein